MRAVQMKPICGAGYHLAVCMPHKQPREFFVVAVHWRMCQWDVCLKGYGDYF
jgi:hypothetical protein